MLGGPSKLLENFELKFLSALSAKKPPDLSTLNGTRVSLAPLIFLNPVHDLEIGELLKSWFCRTAEV